MDSIPANPVYKSVRINVLLAVAYVTVLLCLAATIWSSLNEYAQGVVTLVLGRFLGYTDQVYSFEFGSTRDDKVKNEAINNLTAAAAPAVTVVTTTKTPEPAAPIPAKAVEAGK